MSRIIEKISLVNFRNYESFELDFKKTTTLIVGENGSGKTSVIEAVYLALLGKSFRSGDDEILREGADYYRVDLMRAKNTMTVKYDGEKRIFDVNGKKYGRLPRAERYPVVLFLPSSLNLVASSPVSRRDYFDTILSSIDEKYHKAMLGYGRALKQRNELLKMGNALSEELFPWNVMLAKYGIEMKKKREWLKEEINGVLSKKYKDIARKDDKCELVLNGVEMGSEEGYLRRLEDGAMQDKIMGHTRFGVHRDEWRFYFNGKIADKSASRGETRSMVLALKFIEAEILTRETGKKPLILLDDVFSELDEERQRNLVKNFAENQIIITSVKGIKG